MVNDASSPGNTPSITTEAVEILRGIYGEQGIPSEAIQKITDSIGDSYFSQLF